jgi:ABC-2 type transport system ATP-binding protein
MGPSRTRPSVNPRAVTVGATDAADTTTGDGDDHGAETDGAGADPVIETDGLTKFYGEIRGVEGVTLRVPRGELFGLLGPNGAGKTTLIRLLLGLLRPTDGTATVLGASVTDRHAFRAVRRRIGYLPSDAVLYDELTGRRILDYFAGLTGDERRGELLELFPVPIDRPVRTYSRGNRQKLAIVQAFMHDPDLVVMDEPTSGLDPLVQSTFAAFLERERERGTTVVFSTHVLGEVRGLCDRVAIVRGGRLVAVEDIDTLLARSGKVVRVETDQPVDPADFAFEGVIDASPTDDGAYRLVVSDNYDALVAALGEYAIRDLAVTETAIEDVFMHFYETPSGGDEGDEGDAGDGEEGTGGAGGSDRPTGAGRSGVLAGLVDRIRGRSRTGRGGGRARVDATGPTGMTGPTGEEGPDTGAVPGGEES